MNENWKKTLITQDVSILATIRSMTAGALQVALVVDGNRRLLGLVTDGDLRQALLGGVSLEDPVSTIMQKEPFVTGADCCQAAALKIMRDSGVRHLPRVDANGRVAGLYVLDNLLQVAPSQSWVVIMAGGDGMRLRPLTETCPKPMLKVGGRPILETIVNAFVGQGFSKIFLSVNYLSEVIENHFADGCRWGAAIKYLREDQRLGTAGALSLLPERPRQPIIVMNGDILTSLDFRGLLAFHEESGATVTMCVRPHEFCIPFGVVDFKNNLVSSITEKPAYTYYINAGIYVLNPEVLDALAAVTYLDMPDLLNAQIARGKKVAAYPVEGYWVDVGRFSELEQANADFRFVFA